VPEAISALYATNLFHNVHIHIDSSLTVHIGVVEKDYWRSRFGVRFDEYHLVEGFVQPAYENLFGSAVCASLHLQYGSMREKYAVALETNTPLTIHWANALQFQGYISRERIKKDSTYSDTADPTSEVKIYDEKTLQKMGVLGRIGAQLGNTVLVDGTIRFERFRVTRLQTSAFEDLIGPDLKNGVRLLMLRLIIDNLDCYPFPRRGQNHYLIINGATEMLGGTESFISLHSSLRWFFTLGKKHTLSPTLQFSWANRPLPPVEQAYLGGSVPDEKYREAGVYSYIPFSGLRPRAVSGDITALLNGTYRFRVAKNFYLISLVDWGYTWNEPEFSFNRETANYFINNALLGIGAGLALQTPIGPVKLHWGRVVHGATDDYHIRKNNLIYFSAGHDF
jgi:outer membrane protein assembly factor BamA